MTDGIFGSACSTSDGIFQGTPTEVIKDGCEVVISASQHPVDYFIAKTTNNTLNNIIPFFQRTEVTTSARGVYQNALSCVEGGAEQISNDGQVVFTTLGIPRKILYFVGGGVITIGLLSSLLWGVMGYWNRRMLQGIEMIEQRTEEYNQQLRQLIIQDNETRRREEELLEREEDIRVREEELRFRQTRVENLQVNILRQILGLDVVEQYHPAGEEEVLRHKTQKNDTQTLTKNRDDNGASNVMITQDKSNEIIALMWYPEWHHQQIINEETDSDGFHEEDGFPEEESSDENCYEDSENVCS